ncbi:MAG: hypothetical protein CM1200mP29_11190 [Verrucomicrobiota bacterium]|nr:MAG: hypothetical protein CM1200mP29_11190 [Verrucomicrobiota bacterium]
MNGHPRLMCMMRMDEVLKETPEGKPVTIQPMKAFQVVKDLVTDVSGNFEVKKKIKPFKPRKPDAEDGRGAWRRRSRSRQEFRKCIKFFSFARTSATCCVNTACTTSSLARASSCTPPRSRCTRSIPRTAPLN